MSLIVDEKAELVKTAGSAMTKSAPRLGAGLIEAYHGSSKGRLTNDTPMDNLERAPQLLTDDGIHEFQEIWRKAFKEDISEADARARAHELFELYTVLARALPSELSSNQTQKLNPLGNFEAPESDSRNPSDERQK